MAASQSSIEPNPPAYLIGLHPDILIFLLAFLSQKEWLLMREVNQFFSIFIAQWAENKIRYLYPANHEDLKQNKNNNWLAKWLEIEKDHMWRTIHINSKRELKELYNLAIHNKEQEFFKACQKQIEILRQQPIEKDEYLFDIYLKFINQFYDFEEVRQLGLQKLLDDFMQEASNAYKALPKATSWYTSSYLKLLVLTHRSLLVIYEQSNVVLKGNNSQFIHNGLFVYGIRYGHLELVKDYVENKPDFDSKHALAIYSSSFNTHNLLYGYPTYHDHDDFLSMNVLAVSEAIRYNQFRILRYFVEKGFLEELAHSSISNRSDLVHPIACAIFFRRFTLLKYLIRKDCFLSKETILDIALYCRNAIDPGAFQTHLQYLLINKACNEKEYDITKEKSIIKILNIYSALCQFANQFLINYYNNTNIEEKKLNAPRQKAYSHYVLGTPVSYVYDANDHIHSLMQIVLQIFEEIGSHTKILLKRFPLQIILDEQENCFTLQSDIKNDVSKLDFILLLFDKVFDFIGSTTYFDFITPSTIQLSKILRLLLTDSLSSISSRVSLQLEDLKKQKQLVLSSQTSANSNGLFSDVSIDAKIDNLEKILVLMEDEKSFEHLERLLKERSNHIDLNLVANIFGMDLDQMKRLLEIFYKHHDLLIKEQRTKEVQNFWPCRKVAEISISEDDSVDPDQANSDDDQSADSIEVFFTSDSEEEPTNDSEEENANYARRPGKHR